MPKKPVHSSLAAALDYVLIKSLVLREEAQGAEKAPIFLPWKPIDDIADLRI